MRRLVGLVLLAGVLGVRTVQQPFSTLRLQEGSENEYQFKWPIQRVAIIGAGPSGLVAYRELTEAGLEVRIFERDSVPGGNWHYTEETPIDAPVPNSPCVIGDFVPSLPPENVDLPYREEFADSWEIRRDQRGPKPIWESLTSNVASPAQQIPKWPWPAGTLWELTHYQLRNYVRSYASYLNINSNDGNPATAYNTRVEHLEKRLNEAGEEQGWMLWLRSLQPTQHDTLRATWWTEDFDAVVVASGRYNAPMMPSIPGLEEWVQKFPDSVRHSRQYRRPEAYENETVLIIGASSSGSEISRDLNRHARQIYQSIRPAKNNDIGNSQRAMFFRRMPRNTTIIGEIKQFHPIAEGSSIQSGFVELENGTILSGFDSVILATGFRLSFPFLSQYYDDAIYEPHSGSAKTVRPFLPLNGLYIRDLYLDLFYIPDPTLVFVNTFRGPAQTMLMSDYTALALAKVWTNTAKLPNNQTMKALFEKTLEERGGYGKYSLYLTPEWFKASIIYLTGWLNEAAAKYGGKQVDGFPYNYEEVGRYWYPFHFSQEPVSSEESDRVMASLGLGVGNQGGHDEDDAWSYYGYDYDW